MLLHSCRSAVGLIVQINLKTVVGTTQLLLQEGCLLEMH
jgi:hypothetical protein